MAKKKTDFRDTWVYTGYSLNREQEIALEKLRRMKSAVIALQMGLGKCKHPDSRILTNRGYIRLRDFIDNPPYGITDISDLRIKASTRDGEKLVTHFYREKDCLLRTLHLEYGRTVNGTLKHRVLCQMDNGDVDWKYLADIQCGDRLMFSDGGNALQSTSKYNMTKEMFYLLGTWLSDRPCIFVSEELQNPYRTDLFHKGVNIVVYKEPLDGDMRDVLSDNVFQGNDKYVPEFVFQGDLEQRLWFLMGLFDCDATFSSTAIKLAIKSKALCDGVCDLLASMGVFYSIENKTIHYGIYAGFKYFTVQIFRESFKTLLMFEVEQSKTQKAIRENVNDALMQMQKNGYRAERVVDITEEVSDVMDIEVEDVHEYFSEGLINHNTLLSLHYAMELCAKGVEGYKAPVRCIFAVPKAASIAYERECVTKLGKPYLLLTVNTKDATWEQVMNNEIILVEHTYLKQIVPALTRIAETFPTYLFIDEAHCLQNDKSELSKSLWEIRQRCIGVFCLTGTPLVNSIEGLYNLYHFTFPRVFTSWFAFRDRYCVTKEREIYMRKKGQAFNPYQQKRIIKEIIGYQNMEELNKYIDMLTIKGAKHYDVEYQFLKTALDAELTDAYISAAQGLLVTKDEKDWGARLHDLQRVVDGNPITDDEGNTVSLPEGFVSNKFRLMADTLKSVMDRNEACLIYVEYLETVDMVRDYIESHKLDLGVNKVHILSGDVPEKTRAEIEVIMQPRDVVVMTSSGTASRNLQKANNLIFFNTPFSIQATIQASGRICRVDSAYNKQHVYMLEVDGTIDSYKIMLFRDHLALVDQLMGEECRSSVTCDYVEIDRSRMDYIKKSLLWQKGVGKTVKGSGKGTKKQKKETESKTEEPKNDKGIIGSYNDFLNGNWSLK